MAAMSLPIMVDADDGYPYATELMITADGGRSNASRCRLWKIALQQLSDTTGLTLHVCHFPPGTSNWNKIERRLFCHRHTELARQAAGQP